MLKEIIDQTIVIINTQLDIDAGVERIDELTPLFDGGIELDSFSIVDLICQLEEKYDVEFEEADFCEKHFANVATLAGLVSHYIEQKTLL